MPPKEKLIKSSNLFPVVGIGASAGGLDAFKKLLKAIPEDSGMAYVLVQHLDPTHESMLPELLQKVTKVPVLEIADDITVLPNHIYVIPSNKIMVATDGVLLLSPRPPKSKTERNLPIDLFFTSLAEVHHEHAIGVVLSGTASDGTLGLKAIKDQGGITFAQDEASAAYGGMPQNAAQAGVVDYILPPEKIPPKLLEIVGINRDDKDLPLQDEAVYKQIISLLRIRKGTDFTYYKQSTIHRRILRRMAINKNETPADYLQFLRANKSEQDLLFQDLLIPVTSFFRDENSFENLSENVFLQAAKGKTSGEPIRVWVAGCSTGEEAYSIAICLKEYFGDNQRMVQIFATDISEPAISKARRGMYKKSELNGVSTQRLDEFFTKNKGNYQVNKNVRDMCVFAVHNFLKDPPFGKMDLISCRNVLIYMEPYLQKKALTTFHYALNPKGFLLLGKSETTSGVPDLFVAAIKNDKLYSRKDTPGRFVHVASQRIEQHFSHANTSLNNEHIRTDFQKTADDILLRKYTPAGVVVNEALDIVHFRGNTSGYLEQSPGKPTHNLIQMAKNGLAFELRNILHKAKKINAPVIKENIPIEITGNLRYINIEAMSLPNTIEPYYLVLFHDTTSSTHPALPVSKISSGKITKDDRDLRIQQLEQELAQTREDMRSITEEQEAANEELQSANEELLSGSEELQSLNEELETGKEELQSTNEELTVVNQEMISLNEQATASRDYAEAIIVNLREPLLVLDNKLRIKTANNAFYKTFRVNELETEDVLIYDIGNKQWDIPELRMLLEKILPEKSVFNDFEVTHTFSSIGERVMLLNAREIINRNSSEKLILLSIEDVTERKKAQEILDESGEHFRRLVKGLPAAVSSCDASERINFYNDAAVKIWGRVPEIGKDNWCGSCKMFKPDGSPLPPEDSPVAKVFKNGQAMGEEIIIERSDGTRSNVQVYPQPEFGLLGEITGVIVMCVDITEQVSQRNKIEESEKRYNMMFMKSPFSFAVLRGKDMIISLANESIKEAWGKGKEIEDKPLLHILPELKDGPVAELLDNVYTTGVPYYGYEFLVPLHRKGKLEDVYFNFVYQPYLEADETISGVAIIAYEVTTEVNAQKRIEESEKRFRMMAELVPQKIWTADAQGDKKYFNQNLIAFSGLSFEELKDWGWEKIVHPDDWAATKKQWQKSIETGKDYEMESRLLRKDGKYLWHLTRATALKDGDGHIKIWVGSKTEIHEQKEQKDELEKAVLTRTVELQKANEELEEKHQELLLAKEKLLAEYSRSLIEASLDPLITINADGKITDMNKAFASITEVLHDNLVGTDFSLYFTDPQKAREIQEEVFSKGFVTNYPLTIIDGEPTAVLFNGSVYKDENKKVLGAVLVARDITEQLRFETELIEAKIFAELAMGTAEGEKNKAVAAAHIAEDAVKSKQQFLSNMSHEIRTPMNAIIGFTKVMLKTELSAKQKEYLTAIKMSGDALIVLINDILDLAKVDAGKMTFEQSRFKLAQSISAMLHLFEAKIQEKNLELVKEYDANIPEVLVGDPVRLHQIILNLVSNAVKFTSEGRITVSVRLLKEDEESATIEFAVADTGIGIMANKLEKIFENFQQASSATARLFGGTGLGLAISKKLVEQQGGSIRVESELDKGAVFSFILTFKKTDDKSELESMIMEQDTEALNIKVLVVEDMALNQLLMKTLLDDFGFERDIADNGRIAIEKLQANSYDIILMDLHMPEMNGFEATERIRSQLHSKIPIIALTADVTTVDLEKCKTVGMNDYIAKPVDERLLYSKIVGLVKKPLPVTVEEISEPKQVKKLKYTDLEYLTQRTKNNPSLIMEMISAYLEQTPPLISAMKQSAHDKDWDSLYATVHKMIPSFSIMGISNDFESMAKKVQEFARSQQEADSIIEMVTQLENVCVEACRELEEEFNRIKNIQI